jgi:N-glycosylation protein
MQFENRRPPERVDFFVSALWVSFFPNFCGHLLFMTNFMQAILTGFQCLRLTTGLLTRWRLYYPPLPTLIRLIALQAICWPATHFTLSILEHHKRPVIVWAVVGTTTSVSRSVQIWVTSNLWWEKRGVGGVGVSDGEGSSSISSVNGAAQEEEHKIGYWRRWGGGKWGGRRWDWKEVGIKCVLPAGVVYVIMAWAEALRREWSGC